MCVLVTQLCPTLCDIMDYSPLGSSVHGPGKSTEMVAIPFSRGSSWPQNQIRVSCIAGTFFTFWATREPHPPAQEGINIYMKNSKAFWGDQGIGKTQFLCFFLHIFINLWNQC